jgi:ammonia channel protein AmtB
MHTNFAMVEVGFTQSKNAVNIIMKTFVTVAIGYGAHEELHGLDTMEHGISAYIEI